jgi:D-alanyl-lipoteichoic acid acyltransferase DltB (MBOAT superfamily)
MSYALDVYRGNMKPGESIVDFMLYVSFFPQLVAGPIERATHLLSQVSELPRPTREQVKTGIILIVTGMFKKVMIGDTTGRIVDNIFAQPHIYTSDELLCGLLLFSIQIYADFSGYSSIARGTGRLFGVELMRNFEQPYFSANITEFWRRWHISLSSWLKDYLYISLGGNRKGELRTYLNLIITMLLGGLWHGANWTFVIWGGLHGLYLAVHKLMLGDKKPADRFSYTGIKSLPVFIVKVAFTLALVNFAWLFFRAASINEAFFILGKIFDWQTGEFLWRFIQITAAYAFVTFLMDFFEYYTRRHAFLVKISSLPVRYAVMAAMAVVVLLYMFQSEPLPFIYFQF